MAASVREFFEAIPAKLDPEKVRGETMSYRFDIEDAGSWKVDVNDGVVSVAESTDSADCVIRMKEEMLVKMIEGRQNPAMAFMLGKIKVDGDLSLAMKLKDFF